MDQSTLIELGILAVLVWVVTHPVAPQVTVVNEIPPTQSASGGGSSAINGIVNGIGGAIGTLAALI